MIREAKIDDLESIVEIYNQAIDKGFQTGFTKRLKTEDRKTWFYQHGEGYPLFVYEADGIVVGWLSVSPYRQGRGALQYIVEVSYYLHKDHQRKGIGSELLEYALKACGALGYKTALAILMDVNTGSIKLLEKFCFEKWGHLPNVADFDGVICGQFYYGLNFGMNKTM